MVLAEVLSDDPGDSCHRWTSKCHLRSPKFTNRFFANNFWFRRDRDVWVVSWCFSHQDASIHMQYDLLRLPSDLDLRSNFTLTFQGHTIHVSMRRDEANTMVSKSLLYHFKYGSYHRKTVSLKNAVLGLSWPLTPKRLILGEIWRHTSERAFQELSIAFLNFDVSLTGTEIMRIIWSHVM